MFFIHFKPVVLLSSGLIFVFKATNFPVIAQPPRDLTSTRNNNKAIKIQATELITTRRRKNINHAMT
jgi:hypothetical protein